MVAIAILFVARVRTPGERSEMAHERLDRETAVLLSSLIVRGCSLVWRGHYSGGAVLEDIGGEAVLADLPAVNGRLYLRCVARDREERVARP
jgi:hypothetical protein